MIKIEAKTRKWGNSLGLIIPKSISKKLALKENENIELFLVASKPNPLKETYGMLKNWKKPTAQIMREMDKELYND